MTNLPILSHLSWRIAAFIALYEGNHDCAPTPLAIAEYFDIDATATAKALAELHMHGWVRFDGAQLRMVEAAK